MAIPADSSPSTTVVTTNAIVNVFGPWQFMLQTTTDTQLLSISNPLLNAGNPNFPNSVEIEIGTGEPGSEVTVLGPYRFENSDAGSTFLSTARTRMIIPWKFTSGTKLSARIKATEGPGGAFANAMQLVAMES